MTRLARKEGLLVKVCGLTRADDVDLALDAGADLLGFVSYPGSVRHLADVAIIALADRVREREARSVLVVVDGVRARVDALVHDAGLDAVQLCGREDPVDWAGTPYAILRRLGVDGEATAELSAWATVADAFVLDHPATPGGSGRGVDPDIAARLAREAPCLLAGGLDGDVLAGGLPAPLDAALLIGCDASSRLESAPGVKDPAAVRHFVQSVRSLFHAGFHAGPHAGPRAQTRTHSREQR